MLDFISSPFFIGIIASIVGSITGFLGAVFIEKKRIHLSNTNTIEAIKIDLKYSSDIYDQFSKEYNNIPCDLPAPSHRIPLLNLIETILISREYLLTAELRQNYNTILKQNAKELNEYYIESKSFISLMLPIRAYELNPSSENYNKVGITYGITTQGKQLGFNIDPIKGYKNYLSKDIIPKAKKLKDKADKLLEIIEKA